MKGLSDALGIERPVVLGSSFGGFVAQKYAATYPDHPAGVILAGTCARMLVGEELIERFRAVGGDEAADVVRRDLDNSTEETLAEWRRVCGPLMSVNPDADPLVPIFDAARHDDASEPLLVRERGQRNGSSPRACECALHTGLVGEHDPLNPVARVGEIITAIPNGLARLEVVPNAAHDIVTDNPRLHEPLYPRVHQRRHEAHSVLVIGVVSGDESPRQAPDR